jgi:hypothetical protein
MKFVKNIALAGLASADQLGFLHLDSSLKQVGYKACVNWDGNWDDSDSRFWQLKDLNLEGREESEPAVVSGINQKYWFAYKICETPWDINDAMVERIGTQFKKGAANTDATAYYG